MAVGMHLPLLRVFGPIVGSLWTAASFDIVEPVLALWHMTLLRLHAPSLEVSQGVPSSLDLEAGLLLLKAVAAASSVVVASPAERLRTVVALERCTGDFFVHPRSRDELGVVGRRRVDGQRDGQSVAGVPGGGSELGWPRSRPGDVVDGLTLALRVVREQELGHGVAEAHFAVLVLQVDRVEV